MARTNRILLLTLAFATIIGSSLLSLVAADETAVVQNIAKTSEKIANGVTDTAKDTSEGIADAVDGAINSGTEAASNLADGAKVQASVAKDAFSNAADKVEEKSDDAVRVSSTTETKAGSKISDEIAAAEEAAASVTRKVEEIFSKASSKAYDATAPTFGTTPKEEKSKVPTAVKNLKDMIASQSLVIVDRLKGISVSRQSAKKIAAATLGVWGAATGVGWTMQRFGD